MSDPISAFAELCDDYGLLNGNGSADEFMAAAIEEDGDAPVVASVIVGSEEDITHGPEGLSLLTKSGTLPIVSMRAATIVWLDDEANVQETPIVHGGVLAEVGRLAEALSKERGISHREALTFLITM